MHFIYVFVLMFLSIFGLAALLRLLADALLDSARRRFDVYVRADEDIGDFIESARRAGFIGEINIIPAGGKQDETAASLAEKYADVHLVGERGR